MRDPRAKSLEIETGNRDDRRRGIRALAQVRALRCTIARARALSTRAPGAAAGAERTRDGFSSALETAVKRSIPTRVQVVMIPTDQVEEKRSKRR